MSKKVYVNLSQQDVQNIINAYEKDIEKFNKQKEVIDKIKEIMEADLSNIQKIVAINIMLKKDELLEEIE